MDKLDIVIIAGGKGSRMEDPLPKPLVPVKGKAILSHQIDYFLKNPSVNNIIVSLGHRADEIIAFLKSVYGHVPRVICSVEQGECGTAGGLKLALAHVTTPKVVVLNCDDITNIDVSEMLHFTEHTMCVSHPQLPFGLVDEKDGYAVFVPWPILDSWVSCGWYFFITAQILPVLPSVGMLENDVFPHLKLRLHKHTGLWHPLNNKKQIAVFEQQRTF